MKMEKSKLSWVACMLCIYTTLVFDIDLCRTDISAQKFAEESAVARANLVEKLALRTQEAAQHERNFQQMAELAPCGKLMQRFIEWLLTDFTRYVYVRPGRNYHLGESTM
jgi:hypothetical protein